MPVDPPIRPSHTPPPAGPVVPPPVGVPLFAPVRPSEGSGWGRVVAWCVRRWGFGRGPVARSRAAGLGFAALALAFAVPLLLPSVRQEEAPTAPPERPTPSSPEKGSATEAGSARDAGDAPPSGAEGPSDPTARKQSSGASTSPAHGPAGRLVSAPVRLSDAAVVGLLKPGDRVDVLASPVEGKASAPATVVARRARVARVPGAGGHAAGGSERADGGLILLKVPPSTARAIAGAGTHSSLTVSLW